jgi:hypothetical protein
VLLNGFVFFCVLLTFCTIHSFSIVEFETPEEAENAIKNLNNTQLDGRMIFVREDREPPRPRRRYYGYGPRRGPPPPLPFPRGRDVRGRCLFINNVSSLFVFLHFIIIIIIIIIIISSFHHFIIIIIIIIIIITTTIIIIIIVTITTLLNTKHSLSQSFPFNTLFNYSHLLFLNFILFCIMCVLDERFSYRMKQRGKS